MRPRNGSRSSKVASILNSASGSRPGARHVADDGLEHRRQVAGADVVGEAGIAGAARGVERREVELLVIGLEVEEQLEHFVEHFGGAGVGAVDLVDDDDRLEAEARAPCR